MRKYIKFTGKFRDLKPDGWRFMKLFARNYRCYKKTCDGQEWSQACWIWQHCGGYLEIADFYDLSYTIVEALQAGKLIKIGDRGSCWMSLNRTDEVLEPYDFKIHKWPIHQAQETMSEQEASEFMDKFFDKYREANIRYETVDMLQDLLNKGWIEVREGNVYR